MTSFVKQSFEGFFDQDSGATFSGLSFESCQFDDCAISMTQQPAQRSRISDCQFSKCTVKACTVEAAICENIEIDGLKTSSLFQVWGAVFSRVTIKGRVGRIMLSPAIQPGMASPDVQFAFDSQRDQFYSDVDWALDISQGDFEECEIQGIPAHLIKRDPETQMVVHRDRLLGGGWKTVDLSGTHWATSIDLMLERGDLSCVFVAGKRNKAFDALSRGLQRLRDAGFAE